MCWRSQGRCWCRISVWVAVFVSFGGGVGVAVGDLAGVGVDVGVGLDVGVSVGVGVSVRADRWCLLLLFASWSCW